jgi:two-component system sensor histidine kinase DesK
MTSASAWLAFTPARLAGMTVALVAAEATRISWRPVSRSRVVARLKAYQRPNRLILLATLGAVACSIGFPVLELVRIAINWTPSPSSGHALEALVATACYLPLYVRLVWHAARGSRPPGAGWTLAVMAVVIIGAVPVVGTGWLPALHALAVSVLIVVRPPWSLPIVAGLAAATAPLAIALGDPEWAPYYAATVVWRGGSVFVLVWLVGATWRLQAAREALADEAVARERLRIDRELRSTLGAALEAIAAKAQRATALAVQDPTLVEGELAGLVEGSRRTLADARRLVNGYQQPSLQAELESARVLLTAAGIQTRVVLPAGDLPERLEEAPRAALRAAVARLLRDDARHCAITVTDEGRRVRLELRSDGSGPATTEVALA